MQSDNYQGKWQNPIHSGFGAASTADDVMKGINLEGKIAIVTGGNTGIGLQTTKALASVGATVIVGARDIDKARKNLQGIENVELETLDVMHAGSIDGFAKKFLATKRPLHLLINNAGIMWVPLRRDARGIESQLATNYLGQFHLTARLFTALKKANGARVINLSSLGHQMAPFNFEDPNFLQRPYDTLQAYGQSKTASNLFTLELDQRAKAFQIRAYSVHPGSIAGTELAREAPLELFKELGYMDNQGNIKPEVMAKLKSIPQGAATTLWCATSPLLQDIGGVYCEDADIAPLASEPQSAGVYGVQGYSLDQSSAARLWDLSQQMTGISFKIS